MRIRYRILLSLCFALAIAAAGVSIISAHIIMAGFVRLEKQDAEKDTLRLKWAFESMVNEVHRRSTDWSSWNDTYQFVADKNAGYVSSNLNPQSLQNMRIDMVLMLDKQYRVVQSTTVPRIQGFPQIDASDIRNQLQSHHSLDTKIQAKDGLSGLILSNGRPVALSIRPILRSDGTGPSRGWFIFGRYINRDSITEVESISRDDLSINVLDDKAIQDKSNQQILQMIRLGKVHVDFNTRESGTGYAVTNDLFGKPAVLLHTHLSRGITGQGNAVLDSYLVEVLFVGAIFALIMLFVVERFAVSRILSLSKEITNVQDLSELRCVGESGKDEISHLAGQINAMLAKLHNGRAKIIETRERLKHQNENLERIVQERTREMEYQAFHDSLTGLPNRILFMDRLDFAIRKCQRSNQQMAILFIDLDNFKVINDNLGHDRGDELLRIVSDRFSETLRPGDTVARLGGDEFTVILEHLDGIDGAEAAAKRLQECLMEPLYLAGHECFVAASIGIAITNDASKQGLDLLKEADIAMYAAKSQGKSKFAVFDPALQAIASERHQLENALRHALQASQIEVVYQPLIDLRTGRLVGAEALARWHHPTFGTVSPGRFIPLAEDCGLIGSIGAWILEQACLQGRKWMDDLGSTDFVMSVNLSGRQIQEPEIAQTIQAILEKTEYPAACLKLEITESILIEGHEVIVERMRELKAMGIKLALDDFGTGYSSLSMLRLFPIDTLKIDRTFVSRLDEEEGALAIIEAILALARTMKMDVIGEGIETVAQASIIRDLGCQSGQGYLYDRPLSAQDFEARLLDDDSDATKVA